MRSSKDGSDYDSIISSYYGDDQVTAMISVKVETKDVDLIAEAISKNSSVDDVYILTGETDIMAMVRFNTYKELKSFLIETDGIPGVKETNTSMWSLPLREAENHSSRMNSEPNILKIL